MASSGMWKVTAGAASGMGGIVQPVVTVLLGGFVAVVAWTVREWWRLTTFREQMSALTAALAVIEASIFMVFVVAVWRLVSPEAAVAAYFVPPVMALAKWISLGFARVCHAWWARSLESRISSGTITEEEFHRYIAQPQTKEREGK